MNLGDQGDDVEAVQSFLVWLGYRLPRYGVDGHLGMETWEALEQFAGVMMNFAQPVPDGLLLRLALAGKVPRPASFVAVTGDEDNAHGYRRWTDIDMIVLHQTGVYMLDIPARFKRLNAHVGILRDHEHALVRVHPLNAYCYHAGRLNARSIGIEINGHFPGLVDAFDSEKHSGRGPTPRQAHMAMRAIEWICEMVSACGGTIRHVVPHRCSSETRRADPGEAAWASIGRWAQHDHGLTCMGPGWCVGDGRPIPRTWDDRPAFGPYAY